ncbi:MULTISPECIES: hypothetical protein [Pseudomonas]|uniref:Uncharacterized protein n=1 Tax=Pseudomonas fluorescens TaxID=294 RepID=A0A161YZ78_PSEFL|nr:MULTISPECIES: hypothetical protein [Pseudomonas]KZN16197.1 hypothetical protein A1D17_08515 [Pseudomonas fluorescens]
MSNNSEFLDKARDEANAASDEHCKQWDLLNELASPTIEDLDAWLAARDAFYKAQEKFESIVRQICAR